MITLRQLRYFDALARQLHFGRAAEECGISQPALSQQIQEMEALLGIALVERGARRLALTPKGEEIARRATRILGDIRDLTDFARHGGGVLSGALKLGVIPSVAPYLLPKVLPLVHASFPALDLQLRETRTDQLKQELMQGRLDAVVMALPTGSAHFDSRPLFIDRFLLAMSADAVDRGKPLARPEDIPVDRLLLLEEGHCLRDQALTYCRLQKSELQASFGSASLATIMQMVANGYGVTLLPEICVDVEARDPRIALSRFAEPEPRREIGIVWRRSSPRRGDFEALADLVVRAITSVAPGTAALTDG